MTKSTSSNKTPSPITGDDQEKPSTPGSSTSQPVVDNNIPNSSNQENTAVPEPVSIQGPTPPNIVTEDDDHLSALGEESERSHSTASEEMSEFMEELDNIKVSGIDEFMSDHIQTFADDEFPRSYRENNSKEALVLTFAENFRRQYVNHYPDRKPLFLNPDNECGIEKFCCTTVKPTKLTYRDVYDWDGAAEFVADYLDFVVLNPPTELAKRHLSPPTVLKYQKAHCFEYSTLLCSLLIGVGYDAYVVSGYATHECCINDVSRKTCPLDITEGKAEVEEAKPQMKKYAVRPAKDLSSKYLRQQEERRLKKEKDAAENKIKKQEEEEIESEKPPPDPLFGLRVHSWVLVLSGKREVPESFFIEPFSGTSVSMDTNMYLGIESMWNHKNYWVNMQDCSEGVTKLSYDLGDVTLWEFMFPSNDKPQLILPTASDAYDDEDNEKTDDIEKHLDLPPSWVKPIEILRKDFESRCPNGMKTIRYRKAKLEKFAPYLLPDGVLSRLSLCSDRELNDVKESKEYFKNRTDMITLRMRDHRSEWVTEYFDSSRRDKLREHRYEYTSAGPENDRTMLFYHNARIDGLDKREESPTFMIEWYKDRADRLIYRHVTFGKRVKKFGPADDSKMSYRPIEKIMDRYERNYDIPANDDVAERTFFLTEQRISLTYHRESANIAASTREYIKAEREEDKGGPIQLKADSHQTFQVDTNLRQKKNVEVYQLYLDLLEMEVNTCDAVRISENETRHILEDRLSEETSCELDVSPYDTARNMKARKHRAELERLAQEAEDRRREVQLDFLAPFLAQMGNPEKITREHAFKLREECLQDFKQKQINKANLIQARYEKETSALKEKQMWYQKRQLSISKEEEANFLDYCNEAIFQVRILDEMLTRHKQLAPQRYAKLDKEIRQDPRLREFL